MRLPGKGLFIYLSVSAAVIAAVIYSAFFFGRMKIPGEAPGEIVGNFSFSKASDLGWWKERVLASKGTVYTIADSDGRICLRSESDDSASALFYKERLLSDNRPFVRWEWKVEEFPSAERNGNLVKKDQFDFAAQVYVIFHARFLPKAKAIQYVWAGEVKKGTVADSPYTKNVKVMVLESGDAGLWKKEERDINTDYEKLFGEKAGKDVMAVSMMTDSDSTDSRAVAYYADIAFGYSGEEKKEELSDI
ncbi:MAG: DUF3047 domain-containing protein [Candidatus Omnitrophota bacterium]|nr:DUF3047 domain-containing protein [Candidatus Omnitrophota bacterium]